MYALKNDWQKRINRAEVGLRLMLRPDEVLRLPGTSQGVQVVSGTAWLTRDGKDIFLQNGERVCLLAGKDLVLVSPLGCVPLVVEVFGDTTAASPRLLVSAQLG
jgi:hypothetical protein